MTYCINPECRARQNSEEVEKCQYCGTPLLINNDLRKYSTTTRYSYRITGFLGTNIGTCTEIFEVEQVTPNEGKKRKILKAIHDNGDITSSGEKFFALLSKLFDREQKFLYYNSHPGIPEGYDFFSFPLSNGKQVHCLVMEKIEGVNLEQWVQDNGPITQTDAVDWLEQIVNILKFVHEKQFFHRDIKPSNIMWRQSDRNLVLIDFGAVRDISGTVITQNGIQNTTYIGTAGYVAPEQLIGNAVPQSDFYSLGRTFIFLLTGEHPHQMDVSRTISMWEKRAPNQISKSLINLINVLMEEDISKRPVNTQTILEEIHRIKQASTIPDRRGFPSSIPMKLSQYSPNQQQRRGERQSFLIPVAAVASVILGVGLIIPLLAGIINPSANKNQYNSGRNLISETCNSFKPVDGISCGEETMIPRLSTFEEKDKGMSKIQEGSYIEAQDLLQKAWEKSRDSKKPDPETLIYQNNNRIFQLIAENRISQEDVKPIAVAAPLRFQGTDGDNSPQALEMLRGIAQAQDKAIKNKKYQLVVIANDGNRIDRAKNIAGKLAKNKNLFAVIGHYASSVVQGAYPEYEQGKLPIVSPSSTSTALSDRKKYSYLYRIAPSDAASGEKIAEYLNKLREPQRIAIMWSRNKSFSKSLKKAAERNLEPRSIINNDIRNQEIFNLERKDFDAQEALDEAKRGGVTAIILIPDSSGNTPAMRNAHQLIEASKNEELIIIGGDTLYTNETRKIIEQNQLGDKFLVPVGWHRFSNNQFAQEAERYWGTKNISWLTATAYDATLVLAEATKDNNSREDVNNSLSKNFKLEGGATGTIMFEGSDRANLKSTLVKLLPYCNQPSNYSFVPENYTEDCAPADR